MADIDIWLEANKQKKQEMVYQVAKQEYGELHKNM